MNVHVGSFAPLPPPYTIHMVHGPRQPRNIFDVRARSMGSCPSGRHWNIDVERAGWWCWLAFVDDTAIERSTRQRRQLDGFGVAALMRSEYVVGSMGGTMMAPGHNIAGRLNP